MPSVRVRSALEPSRRHTSSKKVSVKFGATLDDLKTAVEKAFKHGRAATAVRHLYVRGRRLEASFAFLPEFASEEFVFTSLKRSVSVVSWTVGAHQGGLDARLWSALGAAAAGLERGAHPYLAEEGTGGTYFFLGPSKNGSFSSKSRRHVGCFKPRTEEPGTPDNPRGNHDASLRGGVRPGEAAEREVAAHVLSHPFSDAVLPTALVEVAYADADGAPVCKDGSFQIFAKNAVETVSNFAPQFFAVDEIHKIGLLDLRVMNADRNDSNVLVQFPSSGPTPTGSPRLGGYGSLSSESSHSTSAASSSQNASQRIAEAVLVPIDHGYALPDRLDAAWFDICWIDYPQTLEPFNPEVIKWAKSLDPRAEARLLKKRFGFRDATLLLFRATNVLLKKGVLGGLNLREIASLTLRTDDGERASVLEQIVDRSQSLVFSSRAAHSSRHAASSGRTVRRSKSFDFLADMLKRESSSRASTASDADAASRPAVHAERFSSKKEVEAFFNYVHDFVEDAIADLLRKRALAEEAAVDGTPARRRKSSVLHMDRTSPFPRQMASPRLEATSVSPRALASVGAAASHAGRMPSLDLDGGA